MSVFFDTNVLVYCTTPQDPVKQTQALALVAQFSSSGQATTSTQVLIELYNVLVNKQKVSKATAQALVGEFALWPVVASDVALVQSAIGLSGSHHLSIWDAMVVSAAQRAKCTVLYSEDMSSGSHYGSVMVLNPFT